MSSRDYLPTCKSHSYLLHLSSLIRRSVEELMKNLETLREEEHFTSIGLSEVGASTIRRVAAIAPIAVVENELSLFSLEQPVKDALEACTELGIAFTAYSPLGRGFLTQRYKSIDELPEKDIRRTFPRFQGKNFAKVSLHHNIPKGLTNGLEP